MNVTRSCIKGLSTYSPILGCVLVGKNGTIRCPFLNSAGEMKRCLLSLFSCPLQAPTDFLRGLCICMGEGGCGVSEDTKMEGGMGASSSVMCATVTFCLSPWKPSPWRVLSLVDLWHWTIKIKKWCSVIPFYKIKSSCAKALMWKRSNSAGRKFLPPKQLPIVVILIKWNALRFYMVCWTIKKTILMTHLIRSWQFCFLNL